MKGYDTVGNTLKKGYQEDQCKHLEFYKNITELTARDVLNVIGSYSVSRASSGREERNVGRLW